MTYRYESFADQYLDVTDKTDAEAMVRCCFHDNPGSAAMRFNMERGVWICFSCGEAGGIKTLTKHLGVNLRDDQDQYDVSDLRAKLNALRDQSGGSNQLPVLDEHTLARYNFPTDYWGECPTRKPPPGCTGKVGCKLHRWFTDETINAFDLGYDPLSNSGIIPIRNNNGGLIGVTHRYLGEDVDLRYRYPKNFKRNHTLFGSWFVDDDPSDIAVLVEGQLDAIAVWQAGYMGLAQYGSSISPEQIRIMLKTGIRHVVLFYDNDAAGRKANMQVMGYHSKTINCKKQQVYNEATDISQHFTVSKVDYSSVNGNDPGSLDSGAIDEMVSNSQSYGIRQSRKLRRSIYRSS